MIFTCTYLSEGSDKGSLGVNVSSIGCYVGCFYGLRHKVLLATVYVAANYTSLRLLRLRLGFTRWLRLRLRTHMNSQSLRCLDFEVTRGKKV